MINNKIKIFLSIIALALVSSVLASADSYATMYEMDIINFQPWDCYAGGTVTGVSCTDDETLRIYSYDSGLPLTINVKYTPTVDDSYSSSFSSREILYNSDFTLKDVCYSIISPSRNLNYQTPYNSDFRCGPIQSDWTTYYSSNPDTVGTPLTFNSAQLPFDLAPTLNKNQIVGTTTYTPTDIYDFTYISVLPDSLPNTLNVNYYDAKFLDFTSYSSIRFEVSFSSSSDFTYNSTNQLRLCAETSLSGSYGCANFTYDISQSTGNYKFFYAYMTSSMLSSPIYNLYLETSKYYSGATSTDPIFSGLDGDTVYLNSIHIITNEDRTYSPDRPNRGTPWQPEPPVDPDDPETSEWYDSLVNLFSFEVLNPFYGIYSLFTGSDSCVSIPILAGMLNSNQTTYCPWFSSSTRAVLTPVFGIAGVMVLFGFFVSWLKGSSGSDTLDLANPENGNSIVRKKK